MSELVPVSYYCPRCGAVAELDREPYLADQSVTPYPLDGWTYVGPDEDYEAGEAEGVRLVCGESEAPGLRFTGDHSDADDVAAPRSEPCGEPFYLSFVRYEDGRRVEGGQTVDRETVELAGEGPRGPRGPPGPDAFRG
ncbi:MAG: hypothetical protein V5A31_11960 [Haloferacaceae archaeon]